MSQVALSVGDTVIKVKVTAEDGTSTQTYTVTVTRDDFPNDNTTTGEVEVGGTVTGNIGTVGDYDRFKVELEAGTRYQLDLEGADTGRGTLADPHLGLYDNIGSHLQGDNGQLGDDNSGVGANARMIYTPDASGDFYPVVTEINDTRTGTYTLSVIVLGANGASEADTDFPATTGRVDVGASATGNIENSNDDDWFRVDLEAGKTYQFDLEGVDTSRGMLDDPYLGLFDGSGTYLFDDDDGTGLNSRITHTPATGGTYYLRAARAGTSAGTYTLSVRDITPPPPCTLNTGDIWCGVVTVGELKTSADVLVSHGFADSSAGGLVGNPDDTMFSVGDNDYTIRGLYVGAPGGNNDGSLFFLLTADLTDDDKENLVLKIDGFTTDRALSDASRLSAGLYSWANTGLDWSSETTVTVRLPEPTTPDDSGNVSEGDGEGLPADTTTTGEVEVGGSVTGNIDRTFDRDWFAVVLEAGTRYQIDVEGADTDRGTLADPNTNLQDATGANLVVGGFSAPSMTRPPRAESRRSRPVRGRDVLGSPPNAHPSLSLRGGDCSCWAYVQHNSRRGQSGLLPLSMLRGRCAFEATADSRMTAPKPGAKYDRGG